MNMLRINTQEKPLNIEDVPELIGIRVSSNWCWT